MIQTTDIVSIGFDPPLEKRLAVEAMSIQELRKRAPPAHFERWQRADFYRLVGVCEGTAPLMVDFSKVCAPHHTWVMVRPGQVMRYNFSSGWDGWLLVFRADSVFDGVLHPMARTDDLDTVFCLNPAQHSWMDHSLHQMQQDAALAVDVRLRNDLLRLQLASTLLKLSLWQASGPPSHHKSTSVQEKFRRFSLLLEKDYAAMHQVAHYAKALGMGEKTLSRVCLAATGLGAKACINHRLVLESKRLLAHTHLAVQTIGNQLGFDEATNFVKFFRRETHTTPLAFRTAQTGADGPPADPSP